jgi:hypothetical protein
MTDQDYFLAVDERFQTRRGSLLLLTPQDWKIIEGWQESGIPLETALRGIDQAFAGFMRCARPGSQINSLSWCDSTVRMLHHQLSSREEG